MGDLSRNFSLWEFECRCGCGFGDIKPLLVSSLQKIRDHFGKPVHVNSGCRCAEHNRRVGGSKISQHLYGLAADIRVEGATPEETARFAVTLAPFRDGGIGVYAWGVHLDIRHEGPARWGRKWR
ncbi:MAG: hypothetical protein JXR73_09720 [Candidatus Omnitrophica bacterium]|nr:hypothetical protein [Candidatus Omnitrophota bacterium]